jgi:hypothetical protein
VLKNLVLPAKIKKRGIVGAIDQFVNLLLQMLLNLVRKVLVELTPGTRLVFSFARTYAIPGRIVRDITEFKL